MVLILTNTIRFNAPQGSQAPAKPSVPYAKRKLPRMKYDFEDLTISGHCSFKLTSRG